MRRILTAIFLLSTTWLVAQTVITQKENTTVGNAYQVRDMAYGQLTPVDVRTFQFSPFQLAVIGNGYVVTQDEFRYAFFSTDRSDTSQTAKKAFLEKFIASEQRVAEAMAQNFDTTTAFKLEFLKYKQSLITPYLNNGMSRGEAENLPEVKYACRARYRGMLLFDLMNKEVWSQGTDANLRAYFYDHPSLYQGQSFEISRTKVVFDFNKEKEAALDARVQEKFPMMMNAVAVAKL